jgi:hypothetical protein
MWKYFRRWGRWQEALWLQAPKDIVRSQFSFGASRSSALTPYKHYLIPTRAVLFDRTCNKGQTAMFPDLQLPMELHPTPGNMNRPVFSRAQWKPVAVKATKDTLHQTHQQAPRWAQSRVVMSYRSCWVGPLYNIWQYLLRVMFWDVLQNWTVPSPPSMFIPGLSSLTTSLPLHPGQNHSTLLLNSYPGSIYGFVFF